VLISSSFSIWDIFSYSGSIGGLEIYELGLLQLIGLFVFIIFGSGTNILTENELDKWEGNEVSHFDFKERVTEISITSLEV